MSDLSWLNSHTPCNRCVRFATTVASGHATLATKRTLLLTWAGLPPAGSHQLCLAHSFNPRDRACEILRRERREVVDTFAYPDEMYWQAVFRRNGNQDAAARGAVELGHDKTGDAGEVAKHLDLGQRILPDRGVEHQQNGMRRHGIDLLHHAHDLLEFVHQYRLVLQAAGGVDEQHVHVLAARLRERVESETGRVGAWRARDHRRAAAPAPDVELVDGGRTEGIAGSE